MWLLREWETLFFIEYREGQGLATARQNRAGLGCSRIYPEHRKYSIPVQGSWWVCVGGGAHTGAFSGGPTKGKVVLQEVKATEERTWLRFSLTSHCWGSLPSSKVGGLKYMALPISPGSSLLLTSSDLRTSAHLPHMLPSCS